MTTSTPPRAVHPSVEWLVLGAALLHLWTVDGHGSAWWVYGAFFWLLVVGQGLYSLLLRRHGGVRAFLVAGVLGGTALIALWTWTRTVSGVPVGPHRHVEPVGLVDSATVTLELLAVVLLVHALTRPPALTGTPPATGARPTSSAARSEAA